MKKFRSVTTRTDATVPFYSQVNDPVIAKHRADLQDAIEAHPELIISRTAEMSDDNLTSTVEWTFVSADTVLLFIELVEGISPGHVSKKAEYNNSVNMENSWVVVEDDGSTTPSVGN